MLPEQMTSELREILLTEFNKDIPSIQAQKIGDALVTYASLLSKMAEETELLNEDENDEPRTNKLTEQDNASI